MKIQLKNNQTPNDDLTLIRGEQEINVFDKISTLSTKTFNAATITIEDTEGTPSATATINNNTLEMQFTSIKGEDGDKGKQGPDGIIGNTATYNSNVSTLFNVANTTGNSTTKTMTQKAITDLFQNITLGIMDTILDIKRIVKIYGDNLKLLSAYFVIKNQNLILNDITKPGNYIENIQIIMGNDDITSTAYSNNVINISSVTDNVTITIETSSVTDTNMFTKRTTGNGITVLNNKALLKGIRGNSGIWTQFRPDTLNTSSTGVGYFYKSNKYTLTLDEDGVFTMSNFTIQTSIAYYHFGFWFTRVTDHKYYISCQAYIDTDTDKEYGRFGMGFTSNNNTISDSGHSSAKTKNTWINTRAITELLPSGSYCMLATYNASSGTQRWLTENTSIKIKNIRCVDLTKLFGAGNEPTTTAEFERLFPIDNNYDFNRGIVLNNLMTNYVSKDGKEETLQNVSLNVPTLTGKLNGEGESVVVFPNGMKSSCNEAVNDTYDEIKQVDGVWTAIKRIGTERATSAISGRAEYEILAQEEVYVLDDQTIPTELTVANQGIEQILPTNGATPTTAPAIMEIQYPSIPTRGGFLLGNMNNNENDNIDDTEEIEEEEIIEEEII